MSFGNTFSYPENPEKAITTQHQNEAYLLLDTIDRYVLGTDGAYDVTRKVPNNNFFINHQKLLGLGQLKKIAVTEFMFPWSTPNVNIRNNYLFLQLVGGDFVYVVVPEDFYTPAELAAELQAQLNNNLYTDYPSNTPTSAGSPTWVVSVNAKTKAFTIENQNQNFRLNYPDGAPDEDLTSVMNLQYRDTISYDLFVIGGVPSMAYTTYIDVCSNALCKFQTLKDTLTQFNYTNIICRIYLNDGMNQPESYFGSRPSVIYRQITEPKYIKWNIDQMIPGIDIQYRDDSGNLLYIPEKESINNTSNAKFTLKLVEDN